MVASAASVTVGVSTTQVLIAAALWLCVLLPGLVTALKGQWLFLMVGALVGGLVKRCGSARARLRWAGCA